ncbi:MAG: DUF1987 domain-containing protein [Flavobacteriales bacterium]|jgi:hypothetical protein|nr:DUF1987 domain-containing protein [Flavobacteriales bacterium]
MSLIIEGSKRTPYINADLNQGLIAISGISLPENPFEYYRPLNEALDSYLVNPKKQTQLEFRIEYFNTGSAVVLRNLIQRLFDFLGTDFMKLKWYYEMDDLDIKETADEFKAIFPDLDFELIEVEEFEPNP